MVDCVFVIVFSRGMKKERKRRVKAGRQCSKAMIVDCREWHRHDRRQATLTRIGGGSSLPFLFTSPAFLTVHAVQEVRSWSGVSKPAAWLPGTVAMERITRVNTRGETNA